MNKNVKKSMTNKMSNKNNNRTQNFVRYVSFLNSLANNGNRYGKSRILNGVNSNKISLKNKTMFGLDSYILFKNIIKTLVILITFFEILGLSSVVSSNQLAYADSFFEIDGINKKANKPLIYLSPTKKKANSQNSANKNNVKQYNAKQNNVMKDVSSKNNTGTNNMDQNNSAYNNEQVAELGGYVYSDQTNSEASIHNNESKTQENKYLNKVRISAYGLIDFDIVYKYNFSNNVSSYTFKENFNNPLMVTNHKHSVGSQNFINNSFFGLKFEYKKLLSGIELGITDWVKKLFVTYFFNDASTHSITLGKYDTLAFASIGNSQMSNSPYGKSILEGYGALNSNNKRLQLRYTYKSWNTALIMPYLFDGYSMGNDRAYDLYKNDRNEYLGFSYIPRIETSIDLGVDEANVFSLFGSYAAYLFKEDTSERDPNSNNTDIVHAFSLGIKEKLEFLANGVFDITLWGGGNLYLNNYINNSNANPMVGYIYKNGEGLSKNFLPNFRHNNVYSFGLATSVSHEFLIGKPYLKTIKPSFGVGYMGSYASGFTVVDNAMSAYLNASFFVNDYFSITPEIGLNHDLNNGINQWEGGNLTVGINARFEF